MNTTELLRSKSLEINKAIDQLIENRTFIVGDPQVNYMFEHKNAQKQVIRPMGNSDFNKANKDLLINEISKLTDISLPEGVEPWEPCESPMINNMIDVINYLPHYGKYEIYRGWVMIKNRY